MLPSKLQDQRSRSGKLEALTMTGGGGGARAGRQILAQLGGEKTRHSTSQPSDLGGKAKNRRASRTGKLAKDLKMTGELKSALEELKTVKSNYKAMTQEAPLGVPPAAGEAQLRRRLAALGQRAEDRLRALEGGAGGGGGGPAAPGGAFSSEGDATGRVEVAEAIMRKLYERNCELEKQVKNGEQTKQALAAGAEVIRLQTCLEDVQKSITQKSCVIREKNQELQTMELELQGSRRQVAALESALKSQMNNKLQRQLKEVTSELRQASEESASLRTQLKALVGQESKRLSQKQEKKQRLPSTLADEETYKSCSSTTADHELVSLCLQRLEIDSRNREWDIGMWNRRLFELEQEAQRLYAENKLAELERSSAASPLSIHHTTNNINITRS